MKFTSTLIIAILGASAVSAFGLNNAKSLVKNKIGGAFQKPAMVKPIDIDGTRRGAVVSLSISSAYLVLIGSHD